MDVDDSRDTALWLGSDRASSTEPVELPARALLRHVMALGSSGSGKTVLCKDAPVWRAST